MNTRWINCEVCQTEGRILCSNGGPDDIGMGECPECHGQRVVEVEVHPIEMEDLALKWCRENVVSTKDETQRLGCERPCEPCLAMVEPNPNQPPARRK